MLSLIKNYQKISFLVILCFFAVSFSQPKDAGWNGKINGVKSWRLPNAPSGTRPDQCWHAVGSAPNGDIYISGHDHATNSMLYRLYQKDDTLRYVGDARAASQAANNWLNGETCQKFHTRPIYFNGRVYVATLDRSTIDDAWQSTRGFHWYCYDVAQNTFIDLSASEPNGVGAPKLQIITIQPDPKLNVMYGATIPECKIVSYDIAKKQTTVLGRPSQWTQYIYSNRFMWVDSRSRLYISAGNERSQWYQGENKSVFDNLFYYDPKNGFGVLEQFALQGANAIECGQWNREHTKCYVSDDQGHIYCFDDNGPTWTYLGRPDFSATYKVWVIHVSPDGEKIYIGRCDNNNAIYEFDIASKTSRLLCTISECDDQAGSKAFITGYDAWDRNGNFYISAFSMNDGQNVILTRINPVKIKVAKNMLPALVEVTAEAGAGGSVIVKRTGATTSSLNVIYEVTAYNTNNEEVKKVYGRTTIPAGSSSIELNIDKSQFSNVTGASNIIFSVECDGNNYLAGSQRTVPLGSVLALNDLKKQSDFSSVSLKTLKNINGEIVVRIEGINNSQFDISLFDINGKLIKKNYNVTSNNRRYDFVLTKEKISSSGIYILKIKSGNETYQHKVKYY